MAGSAADAPAASRRAAEIGTAAIVALAGVIVSASSLAHDIGWSATGPGAGYFPFRVGALLTLAGLALVIQHLGVSRDTVFATRPELRRTLGVVLPTAALVHLAVPVEEWADLNPSTRATLVDLWRPREIES